MSSFRRKYMNGTLLSKSKIVAIPFAGGNKYSFNKIEQHISSDFEWITLELPGRGERFKEPLLNNIPDMVDDLYVSIHQHIIKGDYVLFGHSMGSLLGYELIKKIRKNGLKLPFCAFFLGRGGPKHNRFTNKKSTLPQELFWEEISKIGGVPKDFFNQKDLLEIFYPVLKNDFRAIENYSYSKMKRPFSIPMNIMMGEDEIGEEEKTSIKEMKDWVNETSATCNFEIVKGNHFFIHENSEMIAQKIMKAFDVSYT
ncbi:thioesterase II family protein [Tenacibaculum piscium]|uniref:thioesterase II family protein n=1 Tax=Tenacibaculum piscium TaxID=1458515 RepID=UPI001F2BE42B|nr:thioesterase domain-containing protein [Tenacibaculum piscium]